MSRRRLTVWVVMHYEFMGRPDCCYIDSVQFHVASSLEKAEAYVRAGRVDPHSWWQVHPHVVDADDPYEGTEAHFYSHRGTRLSVPPTKRALAAFLRRAAAASE